MASPREMVHSFGMALFTSRQPSVVEARVMSPAGYGFSVLGSTHGARDMDSAPPTSTRSASPALIWREAMIAASSEEPQSRLTVVPGMDTGRPASRVPIRAMLRFSSPAPLALPNTTSSIRSGSSAGARFTDSRDHVRGKVIRADGGEAGAELAEGGTHGVVNKSLVHGSSFVGASRGCGV